MTDPNARPAVPDSASPEADASVLVAARREKLRRYREELGIDPFGGRVDGRVDLATARSRFDEAAHAAHEASVKAAKADPAATIVDARVMLVQSRIEAITTRDLEAHLLAGGLVIFAFVTVLGLLVFDRRTRRVGR
jgi:hypothetical protein